MRIIYIRQQDYWIFPLSVFAAIMIETFLYAGVFWIRAVCALLGFPLVIFIYYVIKKNYDQKKAWHYVASMLVASVLTTLGLYYLTK